MNTKTIRLRAAHVFKLLIDDLTGRPLLGPAWLGLIDQSPMVIDQGIRPAWRAVFARELRLAVEQERSRCAGLVEAAFVEEESAGLAREDSPFADALFQIKHPAEEGD